MTHSPCFDAERANKFITQLIEQVSVRRRAISGVRKYAHTLPNEARAQQDGNQIQIKAEEAVAD